MQILNTSLNKLYLYKHNTLRELLFYGDVYHFYAFEEENEIQNKLILFIKSNWLHDCVFFKFQRVSKYPLL